MDDLRQYEVVVTEATERTLRDNLTVFVPPAPSGGPLVAFMLAVIDSYRQSKNTTGGGVPLTSTPVTLPDDDGTIHRLIEITKFAYAKRMELGDPMHIDISNVSHCMLMRVS